MAMAHAEVSDVVLGSGVELECRDGARSEGSLFKRVMYHGTNKRFDQFRDRSYFTCSYKQAWQYAKNQVEANGGELIVYSVFLEMKNPVVLHDDLVEGLLYSETLVAELIGEGSDGAVNDAMTEVVVFDGKNVLPVWDTHSAEVFLNQVLCPRLATIGMAAQIVGSVQSRGSSRNDLDIKLIPAQSMTLGDAMDGIDRVIVPELHANSESVGPHDSCYDGVDTWFFNIQLHDGRVVELYLPATEFVFEHELDVGFETSSTRDNSPSP